MSDKLFHTMSAAPEQAPPAERYRKVEGASPWLLVPCRLCGHPAELWQRWQQDDVWYSFGCCSNLEDVDGEPCTFHLPDSNAFYHPRKKDAATYWNLMMGPRPPMVEQAVPTVSDENNLSGEKR